MSFLSGLKVFGKDIEKAFSWFGSPQGKAVVAAGEATVEAIVPASVPIVNLFNLWASKAYNVESIAVAAGQQTGTGAQKAAMVMNAVTPEILQYAQQEGLSPRTAAQIKAANDAAIAFINAMTQSSNPAPTVGVPATSEPVPAVALASNVQVAPVPAV